MFGVTVAINSILSLLPTVMFPHRKTAKMLTLRMVVIFADYQARYKIQKSTENRNFQCFSAFKSGGRYKTRTCDLPHVKRMRYQLRQSSIFIGNGYST